MVCNNLDHTLMNNYTEYEKHRQNRPHDEKDSNLASQGLLNFDNLDLLNCHERD